jgi:O-antigen biosynthesis protein
MHRNDSELSSVKQRISELERAYSEVQQRLERSWAHQKRLEDRLRRIEANPYFRILRAIGSFWATQKQKLGHKLLHSPLHEYYVRLVRPPAVKNQYAGWAEEVRLVIPPLEWRRSIAQAWSFQPCVSILMPVHNPRREWLQAAVDSVLSQSYENWQLCICDDASTESWVNEYLCLLARSDKRIEHGRSPDRIGISGALNRAGQLARGEYIGFLDHDDALSPDALHSVVKVLQNGGADIIYSDEDYIDAGGHPVRPNFKPGWSPELLLNCMYMGHFLVVSREGIERAGWFRSDYDGAQDYDLVLRMTDHAPEVRHVPQVLYHWRQHPGSSAASHFAKPYTVAAGMRSLSDAVRRRGWNAQIEHGSLPNTYWVRREIEHYPPVSVIVCSRNSRLLKRCLASLKAFTRYPDWEIVVVQHTAGGDRDLAQIAEAFHCATTPFSWQFNFSRMNNLGASLAKGELLIFLNDDVEPIQEEWMTHLAAQLMREDVGVVGAQLLYPSGMIQHAGIVLGMMDGAGHVGRGLAPNGSDFWPWLSLSRNVSAVTGACLAIRKRVFEELAGLDAAFPNNYNDVDLCLRAAQLGLQVIYESRALLRHKEGATRAPGTSLDEREFFHARWSDQLRCGDPYYSLSLRSDTEAPILLFPPESRAVADGRIPSGLIS